MLAFVVYGVCGKTEALVFLANFIFVSTALKSILII